jgi:hypothetical protein
MRSDKSEKKNLLTIFILLCALPRLRGKNIGGRRVSAGESLAYRPVDLISRHALASGFLPPTAG